MSELIKTNFSLRAIEPKKFWGLVLGGLILIGAGLAFAIYILPFLLSMVWGTIELIVAIGIAMLLLMVFTNPKFWRAMRYLAEAFAEKTLGFAIEMNPWNILNLQIEQAEKDREELKKQAQALKAQEADLAMQLKENEESLRISQAEMNICKVKLRQNPDDFDTQLSLETSSTNFTNSKDFIDSVKPIANDLSRLTEFADKAYRKSGASLLNAKNTIKIQKAKYDAVTKGSNALKQAMKAFSGDPDLNKDSETALIKIRQDVSRKVGVIKSAIEITSQVMNKQDLNDAAKVSIAASAAQQLDVDKTFNYSDSVTESAAKIENIKTAPGNNYMTFFNDKNNQQ